ncbi:MAG: tetratricopeptide repeat protein, partial [Bryobacteraceae bacterium]|nr:tetratricopeptide repeat protein [Bryobacteraceae bacterium]
MQIIASQLADPESRSEWEGKAEQTLRRAMELAPGDTRSYSVLFGFYRRTGRTEQAQEVLKQLAEKADLSAPRRDLALGFGYEVLGDFKQAEEQYRQACQLDPGDLATWQRLAAVLIRTDPVEAETVLREIQQRFPADQYAKRALAVVLASRALAATDEDQELWAEVEQLLGQTGAEQTNTILDRRLYAVVLYRRGGREWQRQAREILMDLVQDPETATEFDRQFLAQLHENEALRLQAEGLPEPATEHLTQADEQYQALIRTGRDRARIILSYTQFLLRNGRRKEVPPWCARFEEAARTNTPLWTAFARLLLRYDMLPEAAAPLAKLESLSPHAPTVVELRARWLKAQGKQAEAEALAGELAARVLREAAGDPQREAAAALTIGRLYAAIEAYGEAHRYYRQALAV